MAKDIWINLPVNDVNLSVQFFSALGFKLNTHFPNSDRSASFLIGEKDIVLMLFKASDFSSFTNNKVSDTESGTEVLFSLGANSRKEVDAIAQKAAENGGKVYGKPGEKDGWMYGCGFSDPDGHRWNMLFMDLEKFKG